ncbi:hypothetical protein BDV27DRAFT_2420 [Aspergillus caelatus]|uniref:Uncharacterized protein n=1 Tax=Aspergillus caelatus TaxID=61420 RepID=A0A5N7A472_9EURO|nr:uncharacterized protein BDV27DRAFT_2420 [Aspergillus caelatus]KAE8363989.1 hypothetical protein BDV27DRAFT_2420 [Aspergillus caelatus]
MTRKVSISYATCCVTELPRSLFFFFFFFCAIPDGLHRSAHLGKINGALLWEQGLFFGEGWCFFLCYGRNFLCSHSFSYVLEISLSYELMYFYTPRLIGI